MTAREELASATDTLGRAGVDMPQVDAEVLLAEALEVSRSELQTHLARELSGQEEERFRTFLKRRAAREPAAYIIGEWGFRHLTLAVDPRVLVPRPETEIVVERGLARIADLEKPRVLDVGTGSGAIALAIADEHPTATVLGTDISTGALALAQENRAALGLEDRVDLTLGHLDAHLPGPFDLVLSNPPYVTPEEFEDLEPEIRLYEPREAVVGVGVHASLAKRGRELLRPDRWLVLECGDEQADEVASLLSANGYDDVQASPDLTGRDRVVEGRHT